LFISENYPYILLYYTYYPQNIQQVNILRYAILYKFGSIYLDLNITYYIALNSTLLISLPLITPSVYPTGVNNTFITTQASHPFFAELLSSIPRYDLYWDFLMCVPYIENMMSTGCMFLSNEWITYMR
jgi:inositol phosphorylceramide mannosyltransferase catalytic subunit